MPDTIAKAEESSRRDLKAQARGERAGLVSLFSCPHCGGVLRQTEETRLAEFLCHIGHAYEGEALLTAQSDTIETTAWNLVRALKEHALLARELAALARGRGDAAAEARLAGVAAEAERQVALIEGALLKGPQG
jgi:two-component system chemotaxis response regulator CheB